MPKQRPEPHHFISTSPLDIPGQPGRKLAASLHSSPTRRTGRRILVEEGGEVVFDSDNCYDCANAINRLECWVKDQMVCAHCGEKGLTDGHGQDAETGLPICEPCCEKASGHAQTASMTADDLAVSVATLTAAQRREPEKLAAVAVGEVGEDGYPAEFPF